MALPKFPVLFYKPATALSGTGESIPVPLMAQGEGTGLDYECELVVVIGKQCSEVSEEDALDYVLGYAVGNDVSHRDWQLKHGGGQWSLGKGFDGWAPYGPGIVSGNLIKDPHTLKIWTKVNGKTLQVSSTYSSRGNSLTIVTGRRYIRLDLRGSQNDRIPEPRHDSPAW